MAHVKVVRRSMRPEEWTLLRFSWLKRGVYADMEEITEIAIRDARQISENEYEFTDGPERPGAHEGEGSLLPAEDRRGNDR